MIKKFLPSLMLLCLVCFGLARARIVDIGEQTSTKQYQFTYSYNYLLTQQIYAADEIGMAGTISSCAFYYFYDNNNIQHKTTTL